MSAAIGTTWPVFIAITVVIMGFTAFMSGQALANAWRPPAHIIGVSMLLGIADRFLTWALFQGELLSISGYLIDTAVIATICYLAFRLTLARQMTTQYPWIYERTGPFSWRKKPHA